MKKVISALLACLILLGVIPIGVILLRPGDPGEVFRFMPVYDTYVQENHEGESGIELGDSSDSESRFTAVGNGKETYMQFRLDSIKDRDLKIESVSLRLVALSSNDASVKVNLNLFDNNNWDDNITFATKPEGNDASVDTIVMQSDAPTVYEVNITDEVKKLIKKKADAFSLHLTAMDTIADENVKIASVRNSDPAYRPCLKIITGEAVDTDLDTVQKTETAVSVSISSLSPDESGYDLTNRAGKLSIGKGSETYLKFKLNHENIKGAIVSAKLYPSSATAADMRIYLMENNSWEDNISYNTRPQGKETLIYQGNKDVYALNEIDLTDTISAEVEKKHDTVSLHIFGGEVSSTLFTDTKPELVLHVSDNPDVLAVHNASANLLGANYSESSILSDLTRNYTTDDNRTVHIDWTAYDKASDDTLPTENTGYINSYGEVTRPKWFEGDKNLIAKASISSGEAKLIREIELTLPAEEAPVYKNASFKDYIVFGNKESEKEQMFESIKTSDSKINRSSYTYRTIKRGGTMAFNLACNSEKLCYLTLKLRSDDTGSNAIVVENALPDEKGKNDGFIIDYAPKNALDDGKFLYTTYPLPLSYTEGKNFVTLRLRGSSADSLLLTPNSDSRRIYAAYLTDEPFLNINSVKAKKEDKQYTFGTITASLTKKQKGEVTSALKNSLNTLMRSQVYNEKDFPVMMNGMQTLSTNWRQKSKYDLENWKALYYHSNQSPLKNNANQFAYLKLFACAYKNPKDFDIDASKRAELLDRIVCGIDFFCRAQGLNGGFSSASNGFIGAPYPTEASYTDNEDYTVISLAEAISEIYPYLKGGDLLNEYIDLNADGINDTPRYDAWVKMLAKSKKFLDGAALNTSVTPLNMSALLTLNNTLKDMGSDEIISDADAQRYILQGTAATFKQNALLSESSFGKDTLSAISTLTAVAQRYGGDGYTECLKILEHIYETAEHFMYTKVSGKYDYPVLCMDGTLYGKNTCPNYIEKYPIDIYAAYNLKNNTARKFLRAYLENNRIKADRSHMIIGDIDYDKYLLQVLSLYKNFDAAVSASQYISSADNSPIWYDAKQGRVAIYDDFGKLYIIRTGNDTVKAHYITASFEQSAYIKGNVKDDILTIDYGKYHITINEKDNTVEYSIKNKQGS